MAFQAVRDTRIMLNKNHTYKALCWNSICILSEVNSKSHQKLIAVDKLRVVVYIYSVGCCASISLLRHKGYHEKNLLNGTEFGHISFSVYFSSLVFIYLFRVTIVGLECTNKEVRYLNSKPLKSDTKLSYSI